MGRGYARRSGFRETETGDRRSFGSDSGDGGRHEYFRQPERKGFRDGYRSVRRSEEGRHGDAPDSERDVKNGTK